MVLKILLTGGAGYIGSSVANLLIDRGHKVVIIDNLITGYRRLVPKEATLINCDISNTKKVSEVIRGSNFDLVMHFAGLIRVDESVKNPEKYHIPDTPDILLTYSKLEIPIFADAPIPQVK